MASAVDSDVFPIVKRHVDNGKGRARVALTVNGVEDLFLRPAAVVVGPKHTGIPSTGDDAGAFLDARVAYASEQPDARCEVLVELGGVARVKRHG